MKVQYAHKNALCFLAAIAVLLMLSIGSSCLLISFPALAQSSISKVASIEDDFGKFCDLYYAGNSADKVTACTHQSQVFHNLLSSLTDSISASQWPAQASLSDLASHGKLKNGQSSITTARAFFTAIPATDSGLKAVLDVKSDPNILIVLWKYNSTLDTNSTTIQRIIHSITCPNGTIEFRGGLCVLKELCSVAGRPKCSHSGVGCPSNPLGVSIRLCLLGVICGFVGKPMCPIEPWNGTGVFYPQGALATYANNIYVALQDHTSQPSSDPVDAPSLWALMAKG